MATYSSNLLLSYLALGESGVHGFANWGEAFNSDLDFLEDAVSEKSDITVTTADVTLTDAQQRSLYLNVSGALTGNRSIIVKTGQKGFWFVSNGTSEAYTLTVKTLAGSGIAVTQGNRSILYSDGADVVLAMTAQDLSGYFTRTESNARFMLRSAANYFLDLKADASDVALKANASDIYTIAQTDAAIAANSVSPTTIKRRVNAYSLVI